MGVSSRFDVVFKELRVVLAEEGRGVALPHIEIAEPEACSSEFDEIDYLRRVVLDVIEPEPTPFTTT